MTTELIGFENLPNVYIKEITINDYSSTQNKITTSLVLHDSIENPSWYDTSEFLSKLMQIGFVFLNDPLDIQEMNQGEKTPLDFKSKILTKPLPVPKMDGENNKFHLSFSVVVPKTTSDMSVYAFTFVDEKLVYENLGINVTQNYYGPIKGEKLFQNGFMGSNTYVFMKSNGEYWPGPVHQAGEDLYMPGSYHQEGQIEYLTRLAIRNTKIKDFRAENNKHASQKIKVDNVISDLSISYNSKTDINAIFMLNIKSLLKEKTNYGRFLERATAETISEILSSFRINLFILQRDRVVMTKATNLSKPKVKRTLGKKTILKSHDENGILRPFSRFERMGFFDIIENELRSNSSDNVRQVNEIYKEELSDYKKIAKISELFLGYGEEIRAFQFNDYELTEKTYGTFKYKLSIHFLDPISTFLDDLHLQMKLDMSEIKKYSFYASRGRNLAESQIDYQTLINSYVEKYSYIYSLSNSDKFRITNRYLNFLAPVTATVQTIKEFEKDYQKLQSEFAVFFDHDPEIRKDNSFPIYVGKKNFRTKRISYDCEFEQIVEPFKNDVSFGYFSDNDSGIMKRMRKTEIINRADEETRKNFTGKPNLRSKKLDPKVTTRLSELNFLKTSFFAPTFMKQVDTKHSFGLDSSIPYKKINTALKMRDLKSSVKRRKINNFVIRKADVPNIPSENGEKFVLSSDSMGQNSNFVNYEDQLDSFNVSQEHTEAKEKIETLNSGFQNSREYKNILDATTKLTENEAALLPNQLKSIIAGQTAFTRTDHKTASGDLLSDPKTKNYYEVNNFSVKKLVYLDGFMRDKNNNIMLNKPVYKVLTTEALSSLERPVLCELRSYENRKFNIEHNDIITMDSVFILSDTDITTKEIIQTNVTTPNYNIQDVSYEFMNSEIVTQTNNKISVNVS